MLQANGVDPERTRALARRLVPEWSERATEMGRRFAAIGAGREQP